MPHPERPNDAAAADQRPTPVALTTYPGTAPRFAPPAQAGEIGTFGRYRVIKKLGQGGMGAVYLGYDAVLDRKVALKVVLPELAADPQVRERFLREARSAAKVISPHAVTIFDVGDENGTPFIAMEYLRGLPLDQFLKTKGELPLPHALRVVRETALGLAAAHALGLVHRDVKPANLWLAAPDGRVKILDFGLVRAASADDSNLTGTGAVIGTPAYMSPEQARALRVDGRSDLFSLGVVLYRLVTWQMPFVSTTPMAALTSLILDTPPPLRKHNPDLPEALEVVAARLLSKDPAGRYQTAGEVVEAIRAVEDPNLTDRSRRSPVAVLPVASAPTLLVAPIAVVPAPAPAPQNVWAGIDAEEPPASRDDTEVMGGEEDEYAEEPPPQTARKKWLLAGAGAAAVLGVAALVAVLAWPKKPTPQVAQNPPDSPPPAPVVITDSPKKPPAAPVDDDRTAATYVLSVGGTVQVDGLERDISAAADLPRGAFRLTVIDLTNNKTVTDAGLAACRNCRELTELHLSGTSVGNTGLAHFKDSKKLTAIDLGQTQVTDAGLAHFKDCSELEDLWLHDTRVTDAGLAYFKNHKRLTTLDLSGTHVTDVGLAHFKGCKELTSLTLANTSITNKGLAPFGECRDLSELDLRGCAAITDAGLAPFAGHTDLTILALGGTRVTDEGLAHFKDCTDLTFLDLSETRVTDVGLAHLKENDGLTFLLLGGTGVGDEGLAHFKKCKGLQQIDLRNTGATNAGLLLFKGCKALSEVDVRGSRVTAAGAAEFAKARPRCTVRHDADAVPKK